MIFGSMVSEGLFGLLMMFLVGLALLNKAFKNDAVKGAAKDAAARGLSKLFK